MNSNPNAAEKRWHNAIREEYGPCELHHVVGAKAKHNKVHIGEWFVLGLSHEDHVLIGTDEGRDQLSVDHFGFRLVGRWDLEKMLFMKMFRDGRMMWSGPDEVWYAIMDYRR